MDITKLIFWGGLVAAFIYLVSGIIHIIRKPLPNIGANDLEKGIKMLVKDLNKAKEKIYIVSRSCTPAVYNNENVLNAFKKAYERGVDITVISSATFENRSKLLEFVKAGKIKLYRHDSLPYHLRIVDEKWLYTQTDASPNKRSFVTAKHFPRGVLFAIEYKLKQFIENSTPTF